MWLQSYLSSVNYLRAGRNGLKEEEAKWRGPTELENDRMEKHFKGKRYVYNLL